MQGWSGRHGRQPNDGIIAQWSDGFQRHVAGSLHCPFIVLLQQDSAHQPDDGGFVGKDADHIGAPLDLAIETLDGIVRINFRPVVFREGGVGENVLLGFIQKISDLLHLWPQLIGDPAPFRLH